MAFYDNFERICREKGTTPNAIVVKKLGTSSSTLTYWRNGKTPTLKIVEKIAEALDVKPSDLLQNEEDEKRAEEVARAALFGSGAVVTDEQWDEVKKFAEFIKSRDSGKK